MSLTFPDSVQTVWGNERAHVPNVWLLQAKSVGVEVGLGLSSP